MSRTLITLFVTVAVLPAVIAKGETRSLYAELLSNNVVDDGMLGSTSAGTGIAHLVLTWDPANPATATLSYDIQITGADLDGLQTAALDDDITAIHIHDLNSCAPSGCLPGDTAGTQHILNVYGVPRQDDADMQVFPAAGRVTGIWDSSDATAATPAPSFTPGEYLSEIMGGEVFVMVHTREFPGGAFGGRLVPEPSSLALAAAAFPYLMGRHRRRQFQR